MFMIVSYDIPQDNRRTKIAKTLEGFGRRVQYSVFECRLKPPQLERLRLELEQLMDEEEDDIRFYFLCGNCVPKMKRLGKRHLPVQQHVYIL